MLCVSGQKLEQLMRDLWWNCSSQPVGQGWSDNVWIIVLDVIIDRENMLALGRRMISGHFVDGFQCKSCWLRWTSCQWLDDCRPTARCSCTSCVLYYASLHAAQWRSKALRGPGSTLNLGALPFPPLRFPLPPLSLLSPAHPLPLLRSGPQIQLGGLGSAVSSPSLWRSPSRNRIWCILALKSVIWWQQF